MPIAVSSFALFGKFHCFSKVPSIIQVQVNQLGFHQSTLSSLELLKSFISI
jgi:hypothetical protein